MNKLFQPKRPKGHDDYEAIFYNEGYLDMMSYTVVIAVITLVIGIVIGHYCI